MGEKKLNHKYLIGIYSRVDEFLSNNTVVHEELPDSIVSFCIVVEKILKIKLYVKNPFLVFDAHLAKDDNSISAIALRKEGTIETLRIKNILNRFKIIFKDTFTPNEIQAIEDIYKVRNCFMHGYKPDDQIDFGAEDVVNKMGTIWEKISNMAILLFGEAVIKNRKPKKKYTEEQLERVLKEEVEKIIAPLGDRGDSISCMNIQSVYSPTASFLRGDECPRCAAYTFSLGGYKNDLLSANGQIDFLSAGISRDTNPNLYKCRNCNLELTEKQYEIAKKFKKDEQNKRCNL